MKYIINGTSLFSVDDDFIEKKCVDHYKSYPWRLHRLIWYQNAIEKIQGVKLHEDKISSWGYPNIYSISWTHFLQGIHFVSSTFDTHLHLTCRFTFMPQKMITYCYWPQKILLHMCCDGFCCKIPWGTLRQNGYRTVGWSMEIA